MGVVQSNPEILSGRLCFAGTRVPVEILFDYLKGGDTIDGFLSQYPTVSREVVEAVLDLASSGLLSLPVRAAG